MTAKEIRDLAHELHFIVDYDADGQLILLTGVVDESKRDPIEANEEVDEAIDDFDINDEDDVFDPIEDPDWDPGDYE